MASIPVELCKECTVCKQSFLLTAFAQDKSRTSGIRNQCKNCRRAKNRNIWERRKEFYTRNNQEKHKKHYAANRDKILEGNRAWRKAHPEFDKKRCEDEDYKLLQLVARHRHRAGGANSTENFTAKEWVALCEQHGNKCLACGVLAKLTVDHVMPISQGGTNGIDNIQCICGLCNSKKQHHFIDYRPVKTIGGDGLPKTN